MEQEYKYMVVTSCMTYNHAPYIVDTMNGFTMQETTFPVYYLITDDASTDGEPEVIRKYLSEHFQEPYRTEETDDFYLVCANHNTNPNCIFIVFFLKYNHYSIKKSKLPYQSEWRDNAKYIAICEGDDYWINPSKLEMEVEFLEGHDDYNLVYTDVNTYHQIKGIMKEGFFNHGIYRNRKNTHKDFILWGWFLAPCTWVYRNKIVEYPYQRNPNLFYGDIFILLCLSEKGNVYYMNEVSSVYRILDQSASHCDNKSYIREFNLKVRRTRILFAKKQSMSFRLKFWLYIVGLEIWPKFRKMDFSNVGSMMNEWHKNFYQLFLCKS